MSNQAMNMGVNALWWFFALSHSRCMKLPTPLAVDS